MTHSLLKDVKLLPEGVPCFCHSYEGEEPCRNRAVVWLVAEDRAISMVCQAHADSCIVQLREHDKPANWRTAPIYHDSPEMVTYDR